MMGEQYLIISRNKCFSKGVLTCISLHPLFKGPGTIEKYGKRISALLLRKLMLKLDELAASSLKAPGKETSMPFRDSGSMPAV